MEPHAQSDAPKSGSVSRIPQRISRFALQQRSRVDQPEPDEGTRRLMWAILKDTLRCYHVYSNAQTLRARRLFQDADRWIRSRDLQWLFSFENVCAVLGIDSDRLRNELRRRNRKRQDNVRS